jgi:molecular chaperone GrpE
LEAELKKDEFILELLPVVDNMERALATQTGLTMDTFRQGVEMTLRQLVQLLFAHGVKAMDVVGLPFDPLRHDAVAVRYLPRRPEQCILDVVQKGYAKGDKVFRPAKVIVNDRDSSSRAHCAS